MPPRFEVYRAVSRQIHAIFTDYTPLVEPLSLDEAYLDVTDNLRGIATAWATAKEIRARIYAGNRADRVGRDLLQQIPRQARIGPSKTKRPVRYHARRRGSLRGEPAGGKVSRRWAGDGGARCTPLASKPARTCAVRPSTSCAAISASQATWYYEHRARSRRSAGPAGPRAKVLWIGDNLSGGPDRSCPDRSGRDCDGRRGLGLVRESEFARSDRHGEDQMGQLSDIDPQPVDGNEHRHQEHVA